MKYIAINANSFLLITPEMSEEFLISEGYVLYTEVEYQDYINTRNIKTEEESISELEDKSDDYIEFGTILWSKTKRKVWALNTYNKSVGITLSSSEMFSLFTTSDMIEKSLKTGSLDTAIYICGQLKVALPQYINIANFIINEINIFKGVM